MTQGLGLLTGNSNSHAIRSLKHQSASTQITTDTASGMQCPLAILRKQILDISLTIVNSLGVRKKTAQDTEVENNEGWQKDKLNYLRIKLHIHKM